MGPSAWAKYQVRSSNDATLLVDDDAGADAAAERPLVARRDLDDGRPHLVVEVGHVLRYRLRDVALGGRRDALDDGRRPRRVGAQGVDADDDGRAQRHADEDYKGPAQLLSQ